jgi:hypothetical protein
MLSSHTRQASVETIPDLILLSIPHSLDGASMFLNVQDVGVLRKETQIGMLTSIEEAIADIKREIRLLFSTILLALVLEIQSLHWG